MAKEFCSQAGLGLPCLFFQHWVAKEGALLCTLDYIATHCLHLQKLVKLANGVVLSIAMGRQPSSAARA